MCIQVYEIGESKRFSPRNDDGGDDDDDDDNNDDNDDDDNGDDNNVVGGAARTVSLARGSYRRADYASSGE